MAWSLEEQARMYERSWSASLASGKEQQGNLEVNLKFLEQVDVIRPEMDLLEVGCGIGTVVYELSKKGCRAIGTDISSKAIEYGRDKYPQVVLEVQPAERLSYADESFDVVVSFDLLEHLVEVDAHLKEVSAGEAAGIWPFGVVSAACKHRPATVESAKRFICGGAQDMIIRRSFISPDFTSGAKERVGQSPTLQMSVYVSTPSGDSSLRSE